MTENILEAIAQRMGIRLCKKGEKVFNYGDKGDLFYFILKGEVSVLIPFDFAEDKVQSRSSRSQISSF